MLKQPVDVVLRFQFKYLFLFYVNFTFAFNFPTVVTHFTKFLEDSSSNKSKINKNNSYCNQKSSVTNVFCSDQNHDSNNTSYLGYTPIYQNLSNINNSFIVNTLPERLKMQDKNIKNFLNEENLSLPIKKNDNFELDLKTSKVELNYNY